MMTTRIFPIGAIIIAAGIIFLYIRPTYYGSVADTTAKIQSIDAALTAADRFTKKEAELTTASNAIPGTSIARINSYLPDSVDNIQLILDLNNVAARSNMTLSNFDVQLPEDAVGSAARNGSQLSSGSLYEHLDISLSATGTYQSFRVFLSAIENSLRPMDVQSVTVHQSKTGVYTYDLSVRIYWLR